MFSSPADVLPSLPQRAVAPYELVLQALRDPFLAPLAATTRRHFAGNLFDPLPDTDTLQARALCEVETMTLTARTLARG